MTTELATKIAKTARLRYKELERLNPDGHGSHLASEALEYAEALHGANTFGIEGSCWNMHDGTGTAKPASSMPIPWST